MTNNNALIFLTLRNKDYTFYVKAKCIDTLKKKIIKSIELRQKLQNDKLVRS